MFLLPDLLLMRVDAGVAAVPDVHGAPGEEGVDVVGVEGGGVGRGGGRGGGAEAEEKARAVFRPSERVFGRDRPAVGGGGGHGAGGAVPYPDRGRVRRACVGFDGGDEGQRAVRLVPRRGGVVAVGPRGDRRLRRTRGAEVAQVEAVAGAVGGDGVSHVAPGLVEGEGPHTGDVDGDAVGRMVQGQRAGRVFLSVSGLRRILRRRAAVGQPGAVLREGERRDRVDRGDGAGGGMKQGQAGHRFLLSLRFFEVLEGGGKTHRHVGAVVRDHGAAPARDDVAGAGAGRTHHCLAVAPVGRGGEGHPGAVV